MAKFVKVSFNNETSTPEMAPVFVRDVSTKSGIQSNIVLGEFPGDIPGVFSRALRVKIHPSMGDPSLISEASLTSGSHEGEYIVRPLQGEDDLVALVLESPFFQGGRSSLTVQSGRAVELGFGTRGNCREYLVLADGDFVLVVRTSVQDPAALLRGEKPRGFRVVREAGQIKVEALTS